MNKQRPINLLYCIFCDIFSMGVRNKLKELACITKNYGNKIGVIIDIWDKENKYDVDIHEKKIQSAEYILIGIVYDNPDFAWTICYFRDHKRLQKKIHYVGCKELPSFDGKNAKKYEKKAKLSFITVKEIFNNSDMTSCVQEEMLSFLLGYVKKCSLHLPEGFFKSSLLRQLNKIGEDKGFLHVDLPFK